MFWNSLRRICWCVRAYSKDPNANSEAEPVDPSVPPVLDPPAEPAPPPILDEQPEDPFADYLASGYWGPFRFIALPVGVKNSGRYGAFEIRCVYHRKDSSTGCARYIKLDGHSTFGLRLIGV